MIHPPKSSTELIRTILAHGIENVRIYFPLEKRRLVAGLLWIRDGEPEPTECIIDEAGRYKLTENYTVHLKPVDDRYCARSVYTPDLAGMIGRGEVAFKVVDTID